MKINRQATDEAILAELGGRIARMRLDRNLTQARVAEESGLSKRTLERFESGSVATNLSAFLRILRALDLIERLEALVPEPTPSPIVQLKLQGKQRRRASGSKAKKPPPPKKWSWGDES
jgi:transcriptional regulator with XRE-family HTH domain